MPDLYLPVADRCAGSGLPVGDSPVPPAGTTWTGTCPVCGRTFALGYAGLLPEHAPFEPTARQGRERDAAASADGGPDDDEVDR